MPARLKAPLEHPIQLETNPPRAIETYLDAVAYLHERAKAISCPETDATIDLLMAAAASDDASQRARATSELERFVAKYGRALSREGG